MIFPFVNGSPKEMTDGKVKVGGAWKQAVEVFEKVNGAWKRSWIYKTIHRWSTSSNYVFYDGLTNKKSITFTDFYFRTYDGNGVMLGEEYRQSWTVTDDVSYIYIESPVSSTVWTELQTDIRTDGSVRFYFAEHYNQDAEIFEIEYKEAIVNN